MNVSKIYFDMDGVLADFEEGVRVLCGMEPLNQADYNPELEKIMWERIKDAEHFYDRLQMMPGARELFRRVYEKYGDRCEILTGIPKEKRGILTAAEDKTNWMRRVLSKDIKMNTVLRKEKVNFCTGPEDILIDDFAKTINEWTSKGGTGILYRNAEETIKKLEEAGIL